MEAGAMGQCAQWRRGDKCPPPLSASSSPSSSPPPPLSLLCFLSCLSLSLFVRRGPTFLPFLRPRKDFFLFSRLHAKEALLLRERGCERRRRLRRRITVHCVLTRRKGFHQGLLSSFPALVLLDGFIHMQHILHHATENPSAPS